MKHRMSPLGARRSALPLSARLRGKLRLKWPKLRGLRKKLSILDEIWPKNALNPCSGAKKLRIPAHFGQKADETYLEGGGMPARAIARQAQTGRRCGRTSAPSVNSVGRRYIQLSQDGSRGQHCAGRKRAGSAREPQRLALECRRTCGFRARCLYGKKQCSCGSQWLGARELEANGTEPAGIAKVGVMVLW